MNTHDERFAERLTEADLDALLDEECGEFLSEALPELPVPERVRSQVMGAIGQAEQVRSVEGGVAGATAPSVADSLLLAEGGAQPREAVVVEFPLWKRVGSVALRAAAAVALVAVGVGFGRWTAMDDMANEMHYAHLNAAHDVSRMDSMMNDGNMATLTWSPEMEMTAVTIPTSVKAPKGRALQVWKRVDGEVTSVGFYTPENGALFSFIDAMPMPGLEILITLEPAGGSPQPTTEPLLVFTVGDTEQGVEAARNGDRSQDLPASAVESEARL